MLQPSPLLGPVVALVAWSLVMLVWMAVARAGAFKRLGVSLRNFLAGAIYVAGGLLIGIRVANRRAEHIRDWLRSERPANDLEFFGIGQLEVTPKMLKNFQTGEGIIGPYCYIIDLEGAR